MRHTKLFLAAVLLGAPLTFSQDTVIRGGTVLTVTGGTLSPGEVLIRDGKIAEVGTSVTVPDGA